MLKAAMELMSKIWQPNHSDELWRSKRKAESSSTIKDAHEGLKKMKLARKRAANKRTTGAKRSSAAAKSGGGKVTTFCGRC